MCTTILEASYVHCMKMTASLTSLNVFGMEMMGKSVVLCMADFPTLQPSHDLAFMQSHHMAMHVFGLIKFTARYLNMVTILIWPDFYFLLLARFCFELI